MQSKVLDKVCIAGMILSWAVYYAVSKWAVGATGSAFAAGLLLRAAALIFLTLQLMAQGKLTSLFRQGKTALILLLIGVFGFLLDAFANAGYAHSALGTGTALLKTDVLMVNLATVILYRQKLYLWDWIGTVLMLLGVLLVLEIDWAGMTFNWYDLFFLASALCVSINAFVIKAAQEKYHADTDMIAYYNNFVVLVLFLVSTLLFGGMAGIRGAAAGGMSFWGLVALGGLAQTLIYFFYYRNLKRMAVWQVKLYLLLMPVVSCLIGVAFLGETFSGMKAAGILVVLLGACVTLQRDKLQRAVDIHKKRVV